MVSCFYESHSQISALLCSVRLSRAILCIAEGLCEEGVVPDCAHFEEKTESDQIWTSLLMATSTRARPIPKESLQDENMSPPRLKLYVLSNLLDIAVQCPNKQQRREFIERIMKLNKAVQKVLMSLIERRNRRQRTPTPGSSARKSNSPVPSRGSLQQRSSLMESMVSSNPCSTPQRSSYDSPMRSPATNSTPPRPSSLRKSRPSAESANSSRDSSTSKKKVAWGDRQVEGSFHTPTGYTPDSKKQLMSKQLQDTLLSPGTLESPNQVQTIVRELHGRNKQYEKAIETYRQREAELKVQVEQLEAEKRKQMMKVEATAMDREQELHEQYKQTVEDLENKLKDAEQRADEKGTALKELEQAKEEIEMMKDRESALSETSEKLRVYKNKVNELQDVKEALQREQEAHGKSVDEIVRLENELQALLPVKRQLEDYKIRAVEAEVKLVECQDYLQRIQLEASDQSHVNEHLFKESIMQKQQVEELQRRIHEETQAPTTQASGVGDGINELNPELKEELQRLRNENLQLRAFAGKRQNDAVQKLEESLDDTKRLGEKYKREFLSTKKTLEETHVELSDVRVREGKLIVEVEQLTERAESSEQHARFLEGNLERVNEELERTKTSLSDAKTRISNLSKEIEEWQVRFNQAETTVMKAKVDIQQLKSDLEISQQELEEANANNQELQEHVASCESQLEEMTNVQDDIESNLQETEDKLEESQRELDKTQRQANSLSEKVSKLTDNKSELQHELEAERASKQEMIEEAHKSLEATRDVLQAKATKELEELQKNMNRLLDDERKAARQKHEEDKTKLHEKEQKWEKEYEELQERLTSSLKYSRQEAQERVDLLKKEHEEELASLNMQVEEAHNNLIRKGKAMLADATDKYKEEMGALLKQKKDLEQKLEVAVKQSEEVEKLLRSKISSQKNKLEFSASQINNLTSENDEQQERIYQLERELSKLQEENDDCRQQLQGRYGADGKIQSQLEKLQKEYNGLLEENRSLKKKSSRYGGGGALGAILENSLGEGGVHTGSYGRGGMNREALSELRHEYDAIIENLNDEKRELVMKNSAAATDVKKAEQRAWEAEKEIAKLKDNIVSLQLALQRMELINGSSSSELLPESTRSGRDLSFFSAHEDVQKSPSMQPGSPERQTISTNSPARQRSPGIEKAMRDKVAQENALRSKLSSLTRNGSPLGPRPPIPSVQVESSGGILSPSQKHEQQNMKKAESPGAKMASDVFGLGIKQDTSSVEKPEQQKTLMDYTALNTSDSVSIDGRPECQQS